MPRWKAVYASWELDLKVARLRREETAALAQAGRRFRTASMEAGAAPSEPVARALASVAELEEHARALAERLAASLEGDRRDYRTTGSEIGRWLIVARGILDRLVLRDEAWRAKRELPGRQIELGKRVAEDAEALARLPAEDRQRALETRAAVEAARAERVALLAPYGGETLPGWLRVTLAEVGSLGSFLKEELTKKVYLRLPALTAMAAAWWVTQRFTSATTSPFHFWNSDERTHVSESSLELLSFWLPLVAAALIAYLIATLTKRVRRRYLGESGANAPAA
jgi:hypothetical protein